MQRRRWTSINTAPFAILLVLAVMLASCSQPTGSPGNGDQGTAPDPYAFDPATDALQLLATLENSMLGTEDADLFLAAGANYMYAALAGDAGMSNSGAARAEVGGTVETVAAAPTDPPYAGIAVDGETVYAALVGLVSGSKYSSRVSFGPAGADSWSTFYLSGSLSKAQLTGVARAGDDLLLGTNRGLYVLPASDPVSAAPSLEAPVPGSEGNVVDLYCLGDNALGVVRRVSHDGVDRRAYFLWESGEQTWDDWELTDTTWDYEPLLSVAGLEDTVFVGTQDGVVVGMMGSDEPADYSLHALRPTDESDPTYVYDITVSDGIVYAATTAGLWYSLDSGTSWLHIGSEDGLPADDWNAVATVKNRVYLACDGFGIAELVWQ